MKQIEIRDVLNWSLGAKKDQSLYIIKNVINHTDRSFAFLTGSIGMPVLLHLLRTIGSGSVMVPVFYLDLMPDNSERSMYIEKLRKLWSFDLMRGKDIERGNLFGRWDLNNNHLYELREGTIIKVLGKGQITHLFTEIHWNYRFLRRERDYIKQQPNYYRVNPLLHFTEQDLANYIKYFNLPRFPHGSQSTVYTSDKTLDKENDERIKKLKSLGYL